MEDGEGEEAGNDGGAGSRDETKSNFSLSLSHIPKSTARKEKKRKEKKRKLGY